MTENRIKILTYNMHKGFSLGKLRFMLPKMREAIEAINPDILFLQEVMGEHKLQEKHRKEWPEGLHVDYIAEELWPHVAYAKNAIYQSGHHGNAILSKFPLQMCQNINVAKIARASRSVLHGVVKIAGCAKPLHLMCIHLGLFKGERNEQLQILHEYISNTVGPNEPIIVAGDFNDWRLEATESLEHDLGFNEVFKQATGDYAKSFPAWGPALKMDRVYIKNLDCLSSDRLNEKPWRLLSDHLPLLAELTI